MKNKKPQKVKSESGHYEFIECIGTRKKYRDEEGKKFYDIIKPINHKKRDNKKLMKYIPNSTKLTNTGKQYPGVFRVNKYVEPGITLFEAYKMPLRSFINDSELTKLRDGLQTELSRQKEIIVKYNKALIVYKERMYQLQITEKKKAMKDLGKPNLRIDKNHTEYTIQRNILTFIQVNRVKLKERKQAFIRELSQTN